MLTATVAGRIAGEPHAFTDQNRGRTVQFSVFARPFGMQEDQFVLVRVTGKQVSFLEQTLSRSTFVTCFGGLYPCLLDNGKPVLVMRANRVELMGELPSSVAA